MDPITASGIGLSVTSLAFQLFSGCVKSYQLLQDVAHMPERFEHIRIRLRLEQIRLLSWGEKVGVLEDILEEPSLVLRLHHNLIFDILFEVSKLFTDCLKIEKKFTALAASSTTIANTHLISGATISNGQNTSVLFAKATGVLRRSSELPKRLEWAMVKQDKFEMLVEKLIGYNDAMLSLLDSTSLRQIHQVQMQSELTLLQLSTQIDGLRHLTQAIQMQPLNERLTSASLQIHTQYPQLTLPEQTSDLEINHSGLAQLATFKASCLKIEDNQFDMSQLLIDMNELSIIDSNSRMDTAKFRGEAVWIEWKEFDHQNRNPWYKDVLQIRAKKLVALLSIERTPVKFRGPKCLGYVCEIEDDVVRYGFINKIPSNSSSTVLPRSLLELLKHEQSPSLSQRIRLASALADSLMHLHSVNWLHKGIRSENILFFPQTENKVDYDSPTVSGFEYSRPDRPEEMTEKPQSSLEHDIYRHPANVDSLQVRSLKSWDIYSLGIVLIEIALWKSIDTIASIDFRSNKAKSQIRRLRETLLQDKFLDCVGMACGDRYQEVVMRCVTGGPSVGAELDADESDPEVGSQMIRAFSQDIVDVLKSVSV